MNRVSLLVVRHGETDWSRDGRHTGRADVALTARGRRQAADLPGRLRTAGLDPSSLAPVWTSPASRARDTAVGAGFDIDRIVEGLAEWDYGSAEGRTTEEIRLEHPGWDLWGDGPGALGPGGESLDDVAGRADAVLTAVRRERGVVVLVAHAHLLRVLTARWLGLSPATGRHLALYEAGWGLLGFEREAPQILRWNPPA